MTKAWIVLKQIWHTGSWAQDLGRVRYWKKPHKPFQNYGNFKYLKNGGYVMNGVQFFNQSHQRNLVKTTQF